MYPRIVLFGPPGAGKGTQAIKIAAHLKIPHISTGDIMRAEVASGSELGLEVKRYLDAGELVPDTVILGVVEQRLAKPDCSAGFLLDGFPRTLPQAEGLNEILEKSNIRMSRVVNLQVSDQIVVDRIIKRGQASGRSDDTPEVIQKRLDIYKAQTEPLIAFYAEAGLLKDVDGVGEVEQVFDRISQVL